MGDEFKLVASSGRTTVYAAIIDATGQIWNGVDSFVGIETLTDAQITTAIKTIQLTAEATGDATGTSVYTADKPAAMSSALYTMMVWDAANPGLDDTPLAAVNDPLDTLSTGLSDGTIQVGTVRDGAIGPAAVADIFSTTAIAEAYAADGAAGTPAQLLYAILQGLTEFAISGTTITVKKLDGSTAAMTFTLDDGTTPTSRTRAT